METASIGRHRREDCIMERERAGKMPEYYQYGCGSLVVNGQAVMEMEDVRRKTVIRVC